MGSGDSAGMASSLQAEFARFAEASGAQGFVLDELQAIATRAGELGDPVTPWVAREHRRGVLVDLGYDSARPIVSVGERRYCVAGALERRGDLHLRMPAEPRAVGVFRWAANRFAAARRADAKTVGLAVSEATTNAVLHAYPEGRGGDVGLALTAESGSVCATVRDWGVGMPEAGARAEPGLGFATMSTVAAAFAIEAADGGGTLIRLRFGRREARAD